MTVRLEFEPRDLWIGVYWDRNDERVNTIWRYDVYLTLIPTLPIHFSWYRTNPAWTREQDRLDAYVERLLKREEEP